MEKSIKWIQRLLPFVVVLIGAYMVYDLFHHMAVNVPLAGDDWGYAYEGMNGNAFALAFSMYFSWSGRFFAELWGYIMAANKPLWDMVNPWLFVIITITIVCGFTKKKHWLVAMVMTIGLMVSVDDRLRMETYAWIMGSTYVTALVALLIQLVLLKTIVFSSNKYLWIVSGISGVTSLFIGLDMENAAVVSLLANGLTMGYLVVTKQRPKYRYMVLPLIISIIALLLLRLSPGATYRLTVDNQAFNALPLFDKIATNWPNFLYYTFVANPYPLVILDLLLMVNAIGHYGKTKDKKDLVFVVFYGLAMGIVGSEMFYNHTGFNILKVFYDVYYTHSASIILSVFYTIYTGLTMYCFIHWLNHQYALISIALLLLAGISNGVMVISPIFGARSALYTVYLLISLDVVLVNTFDHTYLTYPFGLIMLCIAIQRFAYFDDLYGMIGVRSERRMMEIAYYQDHPEINEIHITRFPLNTVHSVDIEAGDDYHFETFKKYYGLNPEATIIFEWDPADLS